MKPKFIRQRENYIRRMQKGAVETTIYAILKPRKTFEEGLTFGRLRGEVIEARKKRISTNRIREGLSLHNKFGSMYGIYVRCEFGWVDIDDKRKEKEYRYFVPKELEDINREHSKQENIKDTSNVKDDNLTIYETKVIPEEKQLERLQQIENEN